MKFKDTMTARERIEAFYEGKPYDRIPTGIFMSDHSAGLVGARVVDMHLSAEINTKAQIAAYKAYGTEEVGAIVGVGGVAEILGMKLNFPENSNPYPVSHPILSQEDLENTSLPPFFSAGRFPMFYEISERLLEAVGNEVPVVVGMPGPFTTAGGLRGTENFMRDLYQNPEFAHEVLRLSLEATLLFIRETAKLGVGFSIGEPTASGTLIGAKQFHEFAFPYLKACLDEISRLGCRLTSLHICGNTRKIWNAMVDAGAEILSLDERIDLLEAKREVGSRAVLLGNIPPAEVMLLGSPEDVENAVADCLRKVWDSPRGYILGLGCGLPTNTPPENILAFYDAARKYGSYSLRPGGGSGL